MEGSIRYTLDFKGVKAIMKKDKTLGKLIKLIGDLEVPLREDYFTSLVRAIVGQQLSVKAAATINDRVYTLCGEVTPGRILELSEEELRGAGLSTSKVTYIKDLASKVIGGELQLDQMDSFTDGEIIESLTAVKGIGRWTAEMFLIFSLGRPDVFSVGDLGLKRAIKWLYQLEEAPLPYLKECGTKWSPNGTIASLYLWEAINIGYVDGYKSMAEVIKVGTRNE